MEIWWFLYFLAIVSHLFIKNNKLLYLFTIGAVSTSDIYGIYIFGLTFTPYSLFSLLSFVCLIKKNLNYYKKIKVYFNNKFIKFIIYLVSLNIIIEIGFGAGNYLLYIRPVILIIQWLIIWLYYKTHFIQKESDISFICWTVTIFIGVIVLYQAYGFHFDLVRQSTTYEIHDTITFGGGVTRALGLSREPAHLSIVAILIIGVSFYLNNNKLNYLLLIIWICIGLVSETRSIIILSVTSPLIFLIMSINIKNLIKIIAIIFVISIYIFNYDRGSTVLSISSDMSTIIRYSSIFASLYYYINNYTSFLSIGESTILFCQRGYDIFNINQYCQLFQGAILNSSINHLIQVPYFINIYVFIYFLFSSSKINILLILIFLISGLIMFLWAYPAIGLMFLFAAIINSESSDEHNNLQRK